MRPLISFLLILIFAASAAFALSGFVLDALSRKAITYIETHATQAGLKLKEIVYQDVRISSLDSVSWRGISMNVRIPSRAAGKAEEKASFSADEVTLRLENPGAKMLAIYVSNITMIFFPTLHLKEHTTREELTRLEGDFIYRFTPGLASSRRPAEEIRAHVQKMVRFLREGQVDADVAFSGTIFVQVKGKPAEVKISSAKEGGISRVHADKEDLKKISRRMREKLTDAEIELLSAHPVHAPLLLFITEHAVTKAEDAERKDPSLSEDAYKHVLWSFLLTRAFGQDFAKAVTDAHEAGDPDDTSEDHRMDYTNNETGRRYARAGYDEAGILQRVKTDPAVIRKN